MNDFRFLLQGVEIRALASGGLFLPEQGLLCVSDLHFGKSDRIARMGGAMLPPYETRDTLARLEAEIDATGARQVLCLGDSFDDMAAAQAIDEEEKLWITRLMAGREWIWIAGNHDPAPVELGGSHRDEMLLGPLVFRHIAEPGETGEISGHYHPKAQIVGPALPCFLIDRDRVIMPAFGTYTGGLRSYAPELRALMREDAIAVLTGKVARPVPMPRVPPKRGRSPVRARRLPKG